MSNDDETFEEFEQYCDEINKAAKEWELKWPNHCKSCFGQGGHSWIEMHGFKHGSGEQMSDICSCVERGICPRCGVISLPVDSEEEVPCPVCKWNWCKGPDDACPEI